jgi:hypothetical protein
MDILTVFKGFKNPLMLKSFAQKKFSSIPHLIEIILLAALFLFTWQWIANHAGGPLFYDELLYMNTAVNRIADPTIINRYFHIYLFLPFLEIWANPLEAVRYFWAFLAAATGVFVYTGARLMSRSIIPGLVALLLYFSQDEIFRYPGVAWSDFTVMLLVTAAAAVYLLIIRSSKHQAQLTSLLGMLLYLAFRSKETSLPFAILLIGFIFIEESGFLVKPFLKRLVWAVAGAAAGLILMTLLDYIVLGDILFSLRLNNIREHMQFNLVSGVEQIGYNYFLMISDKLEMFNTFLLFAVSAVILRNTQTRYEKTLYLIPLATISFLVASLLRGPGIIESRYLIPVLPLLCILAAQVFRVCIGEKPGKIILSAVLYLAGLFFLYHSAEVIITISQKYDIYKWNEANYYFSFLHPIALCVLLGIILFFKRLNAFAVAGMLLCLTVITYPSLNYNVTNIKNMWSAGETNRRLYPFLVFSDQLKYSPDMKMGISSGLPGTDPSIPRFGMLDANETAISWMYNICFRQNSHPEQFVRNEYDDLLVDLDQYKYLILSSAEWLSLSPETTSAVQQGYNIYRDNDGIAVLLSAQQ